MPRPSHPLVLRGPAWLGSPWSIALGVSLVLATLVGVYAIGRAQVAFEGRAAFADEAGLRAALTAREVEVTRLRREVAELDTLKVAQERERRRRPSGAGSGGDDPSGARDRECGTRAVPVAHRARSAGPARSHRFRQRPGGGRGTARWADGAARSAGSRGGSRRAVVVPIPVFREHRGGDRAAGRVLAGACGGGCPPGGAECAASRPDCALVDRPGVVSSAYSSAPAVPHQETRCSRDASRPSPERSTP